MARNALDIARDPYRRCEQKCNHDLARGVSIAELLGSDGPHSDLRDMIDPHRIPVAMAARHLMRASA